MPPASAAEWGIVMKNAKYILIGGGILIFIVYVFHFWGEPGSQSDLFDANYMSITPEKGTSSFNFFNVQEYNSEKYFLDNGNLVSQKDNSDKKIQIKNVSSFLIKDNELVYVLFDETDKVYVKNFQTNTEKFILIKNADILLNDNDFVYIYTEENLVYKFDKQWNEEKVIDLKKDGLRTHFERICVIKGKLVFATESLKVYVYDEQKEELHKVKLPKKEDYSEDGDIMQWKGNVYYMLSYYDDGDLHASFTRVDSSQNGIYILNIDNKEMEKVSNGVGDIMLIMDNQIYTADIHLWGLSYRLKAVTDIK